MTRCLRPARPNGRWPGGVPSVERDHEREVPGRRLDGQRPAAGRDNPPAHRPCSCPRRQPHHDGRWWHPRTDHVRVVGVIAGGVVLQRGRRPHRQAGTLSWEYLVGGGEVLGRQTWRVQADYRSPFFMAPGDTLIAQTGVLIRRSFRSCGCRRRGRWTGLPSAPRCRCGMRSPTRTPSFPAPSTPT